MSTIQERSTRRPGANSYVPRRCAVADVCAGEGPTHARPKTAFQAFEMGKVPAMIGHEIKLAQGD